MKKLLLILALVLSFSLSLFSLTACGDDTDNEGGEGGTHTHTHAKAAIENKIDATCAAEGSYDEVVYCASCEKEISRTQKIIEKSNNHNYDGGICTVCGTQKPSEGLAFKSNGDGTCAVSGIGTCEDTDIVIPSTSPEGDKVTSIGSAAFSSLHNINSVTIPSSVKTIGMSAFAACSALKRVDLPDGLTTIDHYVFSSCGSLASISIPSSVTSIGDYAFSDCYSLNLSKWDSGYYIGNEENPYLYLVKATETYIYSCIVHDDTKYIGSKAFYNCRNMTEITMPDGIVGIGGGAFYYCSALKKIDIPKSVKTIGEYAFYDCVKLNDVYIKDLEAWCNITYGNSYATPLMFATNLYLNYVVLRNLVIPDGVKAINDYAFYKLTRLTSVSIPESVETIGKFAFYQCYGLTSITIPDTVKSIGTSAFYDCENLSSVTIGSGVTRIDIRAFSGYSNITSVTFTDPDGWWHSKLPDATSDTTFPAESLADPATAATYLKSTYSDYYWRKD